MDTTIHNPVRDHYFTLTHDTFSWRSLLSEASAWTSLRGSHRLAVQGDSWPRRICSGRRFGLWRGGECLCLRCGRERFLLNGTSASWLTPAECGAGDILPSRAHQLLRLSSPCSGVCLHRLEALPCVLRGKVFDLSSLGADKVRSVIDLFVDKLLILNVDQRPKEDDAGTKETQSPKREDLDEVVGNERRREGLQRPG